MERDEHGTPHMGYEPYDPHEHYNCDWYLGITPRASYARGEFCRNRAQFVVHKYIRTTLVAQGFYCREHVAPVMLRQQQQNRERTQTEHPLGLGFEVTSLRNPPDPIPYPVLPDDSNGGQ